MLVDDLTHRLKSETTELNILNFLAQGYIHSFLFIWNYFFVGVSENIDERTKQLKKIKDEKTKLKVILLYGQLFLSLYFTVDGKIIFL